jgi:hypothetical protein
VPFTPLGVTAFNNGGFPAGIKGGPVAEVFEWLVEQLHRIEPMMTDPNTGQLGYGCWAYSYRPNVNNPNSLSNHSSGTAIDYSAPRHPNGSSVAAGNSGWANPDAVQAVVNEAGVIRWLRGNDPMHFEISPGASESDVQAAANRLRRDNIPGQPKPPDPKPPTPTPTPTPEPVPPGGSQEDDDMPFHYYVRHTDGTIYRSADNLNTLRAVKSMDELHHYIGMAELPGGNIKAKTIRGGQWVDIDDEEDLWPQNTDSQSNLVPFGSVVK